MATTEQDYYELLGVARDASHAEIKRAFRRLARELHPDVNEEPDADRRFRAVAEAYEVLSDPERRRAYDRFGHAGVRGGFAPIDADFGSLSDVFAAFFGEKRVPPLVCVEWTSPLVEIELIAWGGNHNAGPPVEYITPAGMNASPVFSRVARINSARTIYTSGLYARDTADAAAETKDIFAQLQQILGQARSDLRHLVKATYYCSSDATSRSLNELRPNYYDPAWRFGDLVLKPGLVLAIEPMVCEGQSDNRTLPDRWTVVTTDGKRAAHFVHTVAITESGHEVLTLP